MQYARTVQYTTRDFRYEVDVENGDMAVLEGGEDGEVMGVEVRWWRGEDGDFTTEVAPGSEEFERLERQFKALPGHDTLD